MNKRLALSIIIPVYNVELYVEKCIRSCADQNFSDFELVIVNDGSTDSSAAIVNQVAKDYNNITVIHQANQGLSAARNVGLKAARGEYIWFIDSDDWIEQNCLERICNKLKDDLDILHLQFRYVYNDPNLNYDGNKTVIDGVKSGKDVTLYGGLPAPVPFSIYRLDFLKDNKIEFTRGIYHEDSEFKPRATYLAQRIASDSEVSYNYLQRTSGSITSKFRLKNGLDILYVMNSLMDFADSQHMDKACRKVFNNNVGLDMNTLLLGYRQLAESDKTLLEKELLKQKRLFKAMIKCGNFKYRLEGLAFFLNVRLGLMLHQMIR